MAVNTLMAFLEISMEIKDSGPTEEFGEATVYALSPNASTLISVNLDVDALPDRLDQFTDSAFMTLICSF